MSVAQKNKDNMQGFKRVKGQDIGLDEHGQIAAGYQYHDALWWSGPTTVQTKRPEALKLEQTVSNFHVLFNYLAWKIFKTYKPQSVLDLGCGSGILAQNLRNYGVMTVTVDANPDVFKSPHIDNNHFLARTDKKLELISEDNKKVIFDVVISLEHFEHISEKTFDAVMHNILEHTKIGSILIFTAAQWEYEAESQEHIHCNVKSEQEWKDYVANFGFRVIDGPFKLRRAGDTTEIFCKRVI